MKPKIHTQCTPPKARKLPKTTLCLLLIASMPIWMGLGSCNYIQRFFLIIRENRNPCIGVMSFAFELQATQAGQEEIVTQRDTKDAIDSSLFWNIATGECQHLLEGIALKKIPFGGERKLSIKGLDSSGRLISFGISPLFLLENSGEGVVDKVNMDLVRGCRKFNDAGECTSPEQVGFGTLIIRFPIGALPPNTKVVVFRLDPDPALVPPNFEVRIQTTTAVPSFLILANLPQATGRKYTIEAFDANQAKVATLAGTYTIKSTTDIREGTSRVEAQPKTTP